MYFAVECVLYVVNLDSAGWKYLYQALVLLDSGVLRRLIRTRNRPRNRSRIDLEIELEIELEIDLEMEGAEGCAGISCFRC